MDKTYVSIEKLTIIIMIINNYKVIFNLVNPDCFRCCLIKYLYNYLNVSIHCLNNKQKLTLTIIN